MILWKSLSIFSERFKPRTCLCFWAEVVELVKHTCSIEKKTIRFAKVYIFVLRFLKNRLCISSERISLHPYNSYNKWFGKNKRRRCGGDVIAVLVVCCWRSDFRCFGWFRWALVRYLADGRRRPVCARPTDGAGRYARSDATTL